MDSDVNMTYDKKKLQEYDGSSQKPRQESKCSSIRWLLLILLLCILFLVFGDFHRIPYDIVHPSSPYTPEQLHLSLGKDDTEYYVTWSTQEPVESYLIWYTTSGEQFWTKGLIESKLMTEGEAPKTGPTYRKNSYRASMKLAPGKLYSYRVDSCYSWYSPCPIQDTNPLGYTSLRGTFSSRTYKFRARLLSDPYKALKIAFYGDLGLLNAQSVPRLTQDVDSDMYDFIIHNGDFAYDLNTEKGSYGDMFMRLIEPIAARVPYQTSVGNHEVANNFSEYNHRFTMINRGGNNHGEANNFFYSFNAGPIHFVVFSTEFYYYLHYAGIGPLLRQYNWLIEDLKVASSPEERLKRPWIVVLGHRPMYCSSADRDDCSKDKNLLRKGLPFSGAFALEKVFYEYGVDVEIYSHEHQYERFLPIYNGEVFNWTTYGSANPYDNPRAPVHIISGSAGCEEKLDPFKGVPATGSVKQIVDYGYSRLFATRCRLHFQQVSDDRQGTLVDDFIITKQRQNFPPSSLDLTYDDCQT